MELMDRIFSEQNNKLSLSPQSMVGSGEVEQWDDPSAGYNGIMDLDMFRATLVWPQLLVLLFTSSTHQTSKSP